MAAFQAAKNTRRRGWGQGPERESLAEGEGTAMKLRNLGVAPEVHLTREEWLERPKGNKRAELSISGMLCGL